MAGTKGGVEVVLKPSIEEVRKRLAAKRKAVIDLRTPLARASVLLDQWVQKNFKSEGGLVGGWQPFKKNDAGVPIVEARNPGRAPAKLLQDTGRLRSSFAPFADKKSAGIGSDLPYSKPHHKGMGYLPMRKLIPDSGPQKKKVEQQAMEIMAKYNKQALEK